MTLRELVLFIVLINLFIATQVFAQGKIGNGGGIIENQFAYVWLNKQKYIEPCVYTNACKLTEDEKLVAQNTLDQIASEYQNLIFVTTTSFPLASGQIVFTEPKVGSPVYVNTDLLYNSANPFEHSGTQRPIQYLTAALFYHQNIKWNQALEMGQKIAAFWNSKNKSISMSSIGYPEVALSVMSFEQKNVFLIYDSSFVTDITSLLESQLYCSDKSETQIKRINNLHWTQIVGSGESVVSGEIQYTCLSQNKTWRGDFALSLNFVKNEQNPKELDFLSEKTELQLFQLE